ncbi:MAG: hypothetical protein RMK20_08580 [Verrucomicrobiales bacterium]|nr:hypothetical protein [Verrucomicrobiales bacterium]
MKVAFLSESVADEAALKILTDALLGKPTETIPHAGLRHRGWPSIPKLLPAVLRQLHYHTEAEGLVLVVDSNCTPVHSPEHESGDTHPTTCRLCQLRRIAANTLRNVRPRPHAPPLQLALGLAVPAIEAWLLCGKDPHVTEAAWINALESGSSNQPYSKASLKQRLYGTSRPSLALEIETMTRAAHRLAQNLGLLENLFPNGFGSFARDLRSWTAP